MLVLLGIIILSCTPTASAHRPMREIYESPPAKSIPCEQATQFYVSPLAQSIPLDTFQGCASPTPQPKVDERDSGPNGLRTQNSTNVNRPPSFSSRFGTLLHEHLLEQGKNEIAEDLSGRLEEEGTYHELTHNELAAYAQHVDCKSGEHPSMRSSISSSSSAWKKNRTNKDKDEALVTPENVWSATQQINACKEGCASSIHVKGVKIGQATFERVNSLRADFVKLPDRKDAICSMFQYTPDPPFDVRFESQNLQAEMCAACVSSLFGLPSSTFYRWRNDAKAGVCPGGEVLRDNCKQGTKQFFVDLFISTFIKNFGTPEKALKGAHEIALASAYSNIPGLVLMDRYPSDVLVSEWVAWRVMWGDEAPTVSASMIEKSWKARILATEPFPVAVRVLETLCIYYCS
jgi:hypothetical protein